jgi:hypothetical protein
VVCRNVQVARPRASTSAGQFVRVASAGTAGLDFERWDLDHALNELQTLHGLPSGPSTTPGGSGVLVEAVGSSVDGTGMVVVVYAARSD